MATKLLLLAATLAQLSFGAALPAPAEQVEQIDQTTSLVQVSDDITVKVDINEFNARWVLAEKASCSGQSCLIADVVGSTGKMPKFKPEGGDKQSFKCVGRYSPETAKAAENAPPGPKQKVGISSGALNAMYQTGKLIPGRPRDKGKFTARCTANILLFARGTTEPGEIGITVGPAFRSGLVGGGWSVHGVPYDADIAGDYCLGMPGGWVLKDMINQAASKCPESKIFVSGYSQGAMVAHIGVAFSDASAKAKVKGVVVFGDPMQGANIKGYSGPIITYCNTGDTICTGNFELAGSHLAYVGGPSNKAIAELKKLARS